LKRILACLAALAVALPTTAANAEGGDPIGDLLAHVAAAVQPILATFGLKVTLYHAGGRGLVIRDSLGCKVVPMRTAAVDGVVVRRHALLFIKGDGGPAHARRPPATMAIGTLPMSAAPSTRAGSIFSLAPAPPRWPR